MESIFSETIFDCYISKISFYVGRGNINSLKGIKEEFSQKISNFNDYQKLKNDINRFNGLINAEFLSMFSMIIPPESQKIIIDKNNELLEIARKRLNELQNQQETDNVPPLEFEPEKTDSCLIA